MSDEEARCQATRADGWPCTARARPSGFCWAHDPDLREKRRAACSEGGRNKSTGTRLEKLMPRDLRGVTATLLQTLAETYDGSMDPRQASAVATVASAVVRVYQAAEFEDRLRSLEEVHGQDIG